LVSASGTHGIEEGCRAWDSVRERLVPTGVLSRVLPGETRSEASHLLWIGTLRAELAV